MQTSDPDIYAVGDAIEVQDFVFEEEALIPLAGLANRQGRVAADNIFGRESTFGKVQGTGICKVFDLTVAMTGANEKALQEHGRPYEKIYVHPASHAGYYPGAMSIALKLLFDPQDGAILGAQAVGAAGVDKRIDVLASQQRAGQSVFDLAELELAYAPPYGSAKDPVNYAGFVASNVVSGDMKICHTEDIAEPRDDQLVLDVRTQEEVDAGAIRDAVHIPVDELRERVDELPEDKEILAYCKVGLRGYLACRILEQNGLTCRNYTGGWTTWQAATDTMEEGAPVEIEDDTGERGHVEPAGEPEVVQEIDATAEACPGPIMRLAKSLKDLGPGQAVRITAADAGFPSDVKSWCESTGHDLRSLEPVNGAFRAVVARKGEQPLEFGVRASGDKVTIVVFSNDFDRVMAALIIANGAAAMGKDVTLFFTFWGLNVLRKKDSPPVDKNMVEKMFGALMPRGPEKLKLSKMNMGGMGRRMIKKIMKDKGARSLPELLESAREAGVRLVACTMSMDMMGIHKEEMIDGVEDGGVAMYLGHAQEGTVNLFV
jgi:peroxiredoxin family protein/rhodanese-related sulfurtransferase/TusA-related sulfurtransferase